MRDVAKQLTVSAMNHQLVAQPIALQHEHVLLSTVNQLQCVFASKATAGLVPLDMLCIGSRASNMLQSVDSHSEASMPVKGTGSHTWRSMLPDASVLVISQRLPSWAKMLACEGGKPSSEW